MRTKPIRQMKLIFKDDVEMQRFLNYATSTKKTDSDEINQVRKLVKNHKRAERLVKF